MPATGDRKETPAGQTTGIKGDTEMMHKDGETKHKGCRPETRGGVMPAPPAGGHNSYELSSQEFTPPPRGLEARSGKVPTFLSYCFSVHLGLSQIHSKCLVGCVSHGGVSWKIPHSVAGTTTLPEWLSIFRRRNVGIPAASLCSDLPKNSSALFTTSEVPFGLYC